jgi:hypothetical protein
VKPRKKHDGGWATRGWSASAKVGYYTGPRKPDGCRDWVGPLDSSGYPILRIGGHSGQMRRAARIILGLKLGNRLYAIHSCDHPACVEPSHLRAGTSSENALDRERKRRGRVSRRDSEGRFA